MFRQYAKNAIPKMIEQFPEYTVGECILSIINHREDKTVSKSQWLSVATDEDIYTATEKAIEIESQKDE